jgi:hypothetical protein
MFQASSPRNGASLKTTSPARSGPFCSPGVQERHSIAMEQKGLLAVLDG